MAGEVPFIFKWCDKYGLSEETSAILLGHGVNSVAQLKALSSENVKDLPLPNNQRLIMRGALLQFRETDFRYAERRARKLGLSVEQTLFYTKHTGQNKPPQGTGSTESLPPEEVEKRLELRRRVRRRRRQGAAGDGQSLADRIHNQRQNLVPDQANSLMGGSEVSLMSASSGHSVTSKTSANTLPAGHVTQPSLAKHRETRSAADAHQRAAPRDDNTNKDIEEILRDDPDPLTARSKSRSSVKPTSQMTLTPEPEPKGEDPTDELVSRMDAALERLLTEITDSIPNCQPQRSPKGDVKVAMDILEKDLLTEDERRLLASQ